MRLKTDTYAGPGYDRLLLWTALTLLCTGLVLIASASVMEAARRYGDSWFLVRRHLWAMVPALLTGIVVAAVSTAQLKKLSVCMMLVVIVLLIAVLIVGREINEAKRWLNLVVFNLQPAELLKICWIIYFASYTSRKIDEVHSLKGFLKPIIFIFAFAVLLLLQPDFGSLLVVALITFAILWAAGAGLLKYITTGAILTLVFVAIAVARPYRVKRILSFLDPWEDPFGAGYQLTQSLMAFGRGGVTGEGLGNSLQKLGYLPEAHTDFVTSILGEELGFAGMCVVLLLEFMIICRALHLGFKILSRGSFFQGYVAYGIGIWFALQTTINIGAASGGLPTKGLTLPFVSFGGSSLLVCCAALGILLRIDYEWRRTAPMAGMLEPRGHQTAI